MIGYLRGALLVKRPNEVLLDLQGVGYRVQIPLSTFYRLGETGSEARLHVHTHVREDTLQLFGFSTAHEHLLFERLISVSGIGPRLAVAILSGIEPSALVAALRAGDLARLTRIPGVGKKTAERLVVELRDRLPQEILPEPDSPPPSPGTLKEDVVSALANLGYARAESERAFDRVQRTAPEAPFEELLRLVLRVLSGGS